MYYTINEGGTPDLLYGEVPRVADPGAGVGLRT